MNKESHVESEMFDEYIDTAYNNNNNNNYNNNNNNNNIKIIILL